MAVFCTKLRKRAIGTLRVRNETLHSVNGHSAIEVYSKQELGQPNSSPPVEIDQFPI